jgi:hypothetical protein
MTDKQEIIKIRLIRELVDGCMKEGLTLEDIIALPYYKEIVLAYVDEKLTRS